MIYDKTAEQDRKVVEAVGAVPTARRLPRAGCTRLASRQPRHYRSHRRRDQAGTGSAIYGTCMRWRR